MIHATCAEGTSMLFNPNEEVWVCDDVIAGEYIVNDYSGFAKAVVVPGVHVSYKVDNKDVWSATKIVSVKIVPVCS